MYLKALMHKAATRILVCVLSVVFAFSSVPMEGTAMHHRARKSPIASVSCLAPSVKAKEKIQIAVDWKKDIGLLSVVLNRKMFDQSKYPLMATVSFFKLAFANGLAVLNSCAGQSLVKTVSWVSDANPAFINAALAFLTFVQDDSETSASDDLTRFSEPYIKEWLRSRGYDNGNKNISAAVIAKWLSFMTGGITSEKIKVYEYDLARLKDADRFGVLTNKWLPGTFLLGDGRHWTVDRSELSGTKRYIIADPEYVLSHYGITLQFPLSEKDALKVLGAGLERQIQNQKERNAIIFFWTGAVAVSVILGVVFGPSIIDSMLAKMQATNPQLYEFLSQFFAKPDGVIEQSGTGLGFGFIILGLRDFIDKAMTPFRKKPMVHERRRNKTGVLFGNRNSRKDEKGHEQVILEAESFGILLPAMGVKKELWELHGQPWVTRNGAAVPTQYMLPAYEPVFDEETGEFLYWKKCDSYVPNIFYDENAGTPAAEDAVSEISEEDMGRNQMAIISARQKGIILPERGIEKDVWEASKRRWICQNGAKHLASETLAAYVPVFNKITGRFRFWEYLEQVPNPFFVGFFATSKNEAVSGINAQSDSARISSAVEKARPDNQDTMTAVSPVDGKTANMLRQLDAQQRSAIMVAA